MAGVRYVVFLLAVAGGGLLGFAGLYLGYKLGQTKYGRGKSETIQTLFSRITFK
jgi:hypothetical protein